MAEFGGARFDVDTPEPERLNSSEYYIAGWFLPSRDKIDHQRMLLELDGVLIPVTTGIHRNDLVEYCCPSEAAEAGFIARFECPMFRPLIRLVLEDGDERINVAQFAIPVRNSKPLQTADTPPTAYDTWIQKVEPRLFWPSHEIGKCLSALPYRPVVSVVIIAQHSTLYLLSRCVESVIQQHYANFQLVLVLNGTQSGRVLAYVEASASSDSRISLIREPKPKAVCDCLADAMPQITGDYVVWIREDDELHQHALLEIVRHLNTSPTLPDLLYTDEDHIDVYGKRRQPVRKSEFDKEKLFGFDYFGRLTAMQRGVICEAGDLRTLNGQESWDLIIRLAERRDARQVHHVPIILYHRRTYDSSTRPPGFSDSHDQTAGVKVIGGHIKRTGKSASAEPGIWPGSVRTRYIYPRQTRTAIFVRAQDGRWQQSALQGNADRSSTQFYEVNGCMIRRLGTDTKELALSIIDVHDIPADVLLFINRPIETVNHFFFTELVGQAMRHDCGVVTGISLDVNRRVLHAGFEGGMNGQAWDRFRGLSFPVDSDGSDLDLVRTVDSISGHFFALRPEVLRSVGGLPIISDCNADRVATILSRTARERGLHVLITPYAIAIFDCSELTSLRNACDSTEMSGATRPLTFSAHA